MGEEISIHQEQTGVNQTEQAHLILDTRQAVPLRMQIGERLATFVPKSDIIEFPREVSEKGWSAHFPLSSNEPYLYQTFPYTRKYVHGGANLGVGIDQMLNFHVNSNAVRTDIVDATPHISLVTRAGLEAGYRFTQLFEREPTNTELIELFNQETIETTLQLLTVDKFSGYRFSPEELAIIRERLVVATPQTESGFYRYLSYEADPKRREYNYWVSTSENVAKVIQDYGKRRIRLYRGSLSGEVVMPAIAQDLTEQNIPLSLFYPSNITLASDEEQRDEFIEEVLKDFPINPTMLIVRTEGSPSNEYKQRKNPDFQELAWSKPWEYYVQSVYDWSEGTLGTDTRLEDVSQYGQLAIIV